MDVFVGDLTWKIGYCKSCLDKDEKKIKTKGGCRSFCGMPALRIWTILSRRLKIPSGTGCSDFWGMLLHDFSWCPLVLSQNSIPCKLFYDPALHDAWFLSQGMGKLGSRPHARVQLGRRIGGLLGGPEAHANQLADVRKPRGGVVEAPKVIAISRQTSARAIGEREHSAMHEQCPFFLRRPFFSSASFRSRELLFPNTCFCFFPPSGASVPEHILLFLSAIASVFKHMVLLLCCCFV